MDNQAGTHFVWMLLIFVVWWPVVILLMSYLDEWRQLAKIYRATLEPDGTAFLWQRGRVGRLFYNNGLNYHVTQEGLFIGLVFIFRIGHPTLFIPWGDLVVIKERTLLFGYRTVTLGVGNPQITTLTMPRKVLEGTPLLPPIGD